ncbi:MAG: hypothetical protein HZY76_18150 [Anaerolineae bacterium]|nr:MAG: hypothetical protein HZY76_18150 [Anaerolineae bacterium]
MGRWRAAAGAGEQPALGRTPGRSAGGFYPAPGVVHGQQSVSTVRGGLEATYRITVAADQPAHVRLEIENELCPSYVDLIDAGRPAVAYWSRQGCPRRRRMMTRGVVNRAVGYLAVFQTHPPPVSVRGQEGLLALTVVPTFAWTLAPGTAAVLGLRWRAMTIETI